jgi:hypothetical protein
VIATGEDPVKVGLVEAERAVDRPQGAVGRLVVIPGASGTKSRGGPMLDIRRREFITSISKWPVGSMLK